MNAKAIRQLMDLELARMKKTEMLMEQRERLPPVAELVERQAPGGNRVVNSDAVTTTLLGPTRNWLIATAL